MDLENTTRRLRRHEDGWKWRGNGVEMASCFRYMEVARPFSRRVI